MFCKRKEEETVVLSLERRDISTKTTKKNDKETINLAIYLSTIYVPDEHHAF